jgi:hypothetical protein
MKTEGPALESLLRRLAETPDDFLAEPRMGGSGSVHVAAVIHDCLAQFGYAAGPQDLGFVQGTDPKNDRNRQGIALVAAWLLTGPWFRQHPVAGGDLLKALSISAFEMAPYVMARKFVEDPDRREEMARFALARLDMRPAGESIAQAQDRLTTVSTAERVRVFHAAQAAEERARAIREALARKAAEESADKYTRE